MRKECDLSQKTFLCLNIIISFIFFLFLFYLQKNMCLFNDDLYVNADNLNDLTLFSNPLNYHGGGWLCFFMFKLFNYFIPSFLNYHPSDFISFQCAILKSIITVFICFLISKFSVIFFKSEKILSLFFALTSLYIILIVCNQNEENFISMMISNFVYFRCFFILLFFSIFWYFICKNITSDDELKKCKLIPICLCGFVISSSIEILLCSSVILFSLIIMYNAIIYIIKNICKKFETYDFKFILNQNFWVPVASLILGTSFYVFSSGFIDVAKMRGLNNISINFDVLKEFSFLYFQIYILNFWFYWVIFLALLIVAVINCVQSKKNIKMLVLSLFMQISIMLAVFSLIFCGKTEYSGHYWLVSGRVIALYQVIVLYSLYMLFSVIFDSLRKIPISFINFFLISLIISLTIFYNLGYKKLIDDNVYVKFYKSIKKDNYIAEKMLRFYYLKDEIPILPLQLRKDEREPNSSYIYFFRFESYSEDCSNSSFMANVYYPLIYKDYKSIKDGYCFSSSAYEQFFDKGGVLTEEELKNIKFSRLLNDNFVLNK